MKTSLLALILFLLNITCYSQNILYVNQISSAGTTTLVQTGTSNKIGSSGTPSEITSENVDFELRQVGNSNESDFSFIGNNLTLNSITTGNSNISKMYMTGASNNIDLAFTGNSNNFLLNKTGLVGSAVKSNATNSNIDFVVAGNSNILQFGIDDGKYNVLNYNITGNTNTVTSKQVGNPSGQSAGTGHEQTVTITGSTNTLDILQAGIEKQTAVINLTGSSNTVSVQQTTAAAVPAGP